VSHTQFSPASDTLRHATWHRDGAQDRGRQEGHQRGIGRLQRCRNQSLTPSGTVSRHGCALVLRSACVRTERCPWVYQVVPGIDDMDGFGLIVRVAGIGQPLAGKPAPVGLSSCSQGDLVFFRYVVQRCPAWSPNTSLAAESLIIGGRPRRGGRAQACTPYRPQRADYRSA